MFITRFSVNLICYWREFPVEILRPKTLNRYTNMKGKGVRNLQHEYTAMHHFLILFHQNVEQANVLFSFRFKQLHHIEKRMKQITIVSICYNGCIQHSDVITARYSVCRSSFLLSLRNIYDERYIYQTIFSAHIFWFPV